MTSMFIEPSTKKIGVNVNKNQKLNATVSKKGVTTNNSKILINFIKLY